MSDNTTLNAGAGGNVVRDIDKSGVKTQVVVIDLGGSGAESLLTGTLPVSLASTEISNLPATQPVSIASMPSTPVTGVFYQATQPISIAAAVTVDGSGVVQPISGTVTANAGTNLNTSALATHAKQDTGNTSLATLAGAVAGTELQVDVLTMPTTEVTGTFWQATQPISGAVTDSGSGKTLKSAVISLTSTGTVVALVAGKRIKVYAIKIICSAALAINWRSGASTALEGIQSIAINGGYGEVINPPAFLFGTTAGESLDLVITGIGTVAGRVSYWDDDVA